MPQDESWRSGWKRCTLAHGMLYRPTLRAWWWGLQSVMASLHSRNIPPCSAPICRTGAATAWLQFQHAALHGVLCAATELRLYQDENIIVLNSGVTVKAPSRSNPSLSEVYTRDSGNHTSGLRYLPTLGSVRTRLWIYPLAQSEGQLSPWDKLGTEL